MKKGLLAFALIACGSSSKKPVTPDHPDKPGPVVTATADKDKAPAPAPPPASKSLFDRLGGQPAITAVVDDFVTRTTSDPRIKERFFNTDAVHLKQMLVEFVCMATGGPCKYSGRDMTTAHAGMDLVDEEFGALVENLKATLDKFKVPEKEQGELLGALGPLKPQIVVTADKLSPIDAKSLAKVTALAGTIKDPAAKDLLAAAVTAGQRGQRSYAEQLFSRAEILIGAKPLASVAMVFRKGAPERITTPLKTIPDGAPQPTSVGSNESDEPVKKPERGSLDGSLQIDGKGPEALGVVMLWPANGGGQKRIPKQRVIEQRDKKFVPQLMAVPVGSTVAFPNYDNIFHNVFSLSKTSSFDLGMYKNGQSREIKFTKPGIVRLGCNLHASMSAFLIIVDAPYYAVVNSDGKYKFNSLAPGKYKIRAWTERSGDPVDTEVVVAVGENHKQLELKSVKASLSPDKFGAPR